MRTVIVNLDSLLLQFLFTERRQIMQKRKLYISGMMCGNCQLRIENELKRTLGIANVTVSFEKETAEILYDEKQISLEQIKNIIDRLGYKATVKKTSRKKFLLTSGVELFAIAVLFLLLQYSGVIGYLTPSSLAVSEMGYGMLFVIGIITSVHCIAMCGGINLSQTIQKTQTKEISRSMFRNSFLYNTGRVISYTLIGGILGAVSALAGIGTDLQTSSTIQGILKLIAGIIMIIMGVNMLGLFPWLRNLKLHIPFLTSKIFQTRSKAKGHSKAPFVVGLCNGLMPCGPLQSVQIIALASGNPITGALSMFCFSLGTVPLMLGFGSAVSLLGKRFTRQVLKVGSILIVVMGLSMMAQGSALANLGTNFDTRFLNLVSKNSATQNTDTATEKNGVQYVSSILESGKYPDITVKAGESVEWTIQASKENINGCNYKILLQDFGQEHVFEEGENVISFTPSTPGVYTYTCWMGMITGKIYVENS